MIAHLPPSVAVCVVLLDDEDRVARLERDLVRVLGVKVVQGVDLLLRRLRHRAAEERAHLSLSALSCWLSMCGWLRYCRRVWRGGEWVGGGWKYVCLYAGAMLARSCHSDCPDWEIVDVAVGLLGRGLRWNPLWTIEGTAPVSHSVKGTQRNAPPHPAPRSARDPARGDRPKLITLFGDQPAASLPPWRLRLICIISSERE